MLNDGVLPEKAWEIVKNLRKDDYYSKMKACDTVDAANFLPIHKIMSNFDSMATFIDQSISFEAQNIPRKNIDLAGKMFVFLNSCPSPFVYFYNHVFHKRSTKEMLIALTQQKKIALRPKSQEIAEILFKKLQSALGFHYNKPSELFEWKKKISSDLGKSRKTYTSFHILHISEKKSLQSAISHPPHIINEDGNKSLSSFIPFCSFGEDMQEMGTNVKGFDVPVCNSFKAKVIHDQLCYEVDLKKFGKEENRENELKHGLILLLDLNEDRQSFDGEKEMNNHTNFYIKNNENSVQIYLDTICNN